MFKPLIDGKLVVWTKPSLDGLTLADLKKKEITAIIDLNQSTEEAAEAARLGLNYVADEKFYIEDNFHAILVERLRYITLKIHELISSGEYVYLHCTMSKGRSPTVAAAYLICLGMGESQAKEMVKNVRHEAWKGDDKNYAALLRQFENKYRGSCAN